MPNNFCPFINGACKLDCKFHYYGDYMISRYCRIKDFLTSNNGSIEKLSEMIKAARDLAD